MTYRVLTGCRSCDATLRPVLDLGQTPIANNLCKTREEALAAPTFPLELMRCTARDCGLYQLSIAVDAETLYGNYTYATPKNPELDEHYRRTYSWFANCFHPSSVVEIGSNNGAFLQWWARGRARWVVGVEPSAIEAPDITTIREFFDRTTATQIIETRGHADLVIARHCLAHIDDVHAILSGVSDLLDEEGIFYIENAYFIDSMLGAQFDQVYHEHMSYLTIDAVQWLLREHGMRLMDVNFSDVHGGSFMLVAAHETSSHQPTVNVPVAIRAERAWLAQGLELRFCEESCLAIAATYDAVVKEVERGHVVDAYGAAAKAVTRFAAAKITREHVRQCIDDSPIKQGNFLPGSGIPIVGREAWGDNLLWRLQDTGHHHAEKRPDAVLLTAWNYERSFREREKAYLDAGGRFIIP